MQIKYNQNHEEYKVAEGKVVLKKVPDYLATVLSIPVGESRAFNIEGEKNG